MKRRFQSRVATQEDPELTSSMDTKSTPIYKALPPEEQHRANQIASAQQKMYHIQKGKTETQS